MKNRYFHIITLGCPKNQTDSENMTALLEGAGFIWSEDPRSADLVIINTCCFIEPAREEAINTILETSRLMEETGGRLIVTGCLPQRYGDEVASALPEVDSWMGLSKIADIVSVAGETMNGGRLRSYMGGAPSVYEDLPSVYLTPGHYGYLKIAEGCSHKCSFCAIPGIRGKYRSLPMERIVENASNLARSGRKEILLIAQDTSNYGVDLYGKRKLAELLERLCQVEGIRWIRLMYAYPSTLSDQVLRVMAGEEKICKYLDIPLQHSHPEVLKKMGRPFTEKDTYGLIEKIRNIMPSAVIRTAFITGHPGETSARFSHLLKFVEKSEFYHAGVFAYSYEEGTKSALYKTRPSKREAERRAGELMALQAEISARLRRKQMGRILPAVSEYVLEETGFDGAVMVDMEGGQVRGSSALPAGTVAIGRTVFDAPDIDGLLYIKGSALPEGKFFRVRIDESFQYDLSGVPVGE